jgi:hypothetical protein
MKTGKLACSLDNARRARAAHAEAPGRPLRRYRFAPTAAMSNAPSTDMLDGKPYPLAAAGDPLNAFTVQ